MSYRSRLSIALTVAAVLAATGCSAGRSPGLTPVASPTSSTRGPSYDASSGLAWQWPAPPRGSVGMPTADSDGIAFTYGHVATVLLDPHGRELWRTERVGVRDVAPLLTADAVLVATDDGLVSYGRKSGVQRWELVAGERVNTAVRARDLAVVTTWEGSLLAYDLETGRQAWRAPLSGVSLAAAATDGKTVVASWEREGATAAGITAFDALTGAQRWAQALRPDGVSGPTITAEGLVVVVAGDAAAHSFDATSGQPRWSVAMEDGGSQEVPPLALEPGAEAVLVAHRLGGLALIGLTDGEVRWKAGSDGAAVRGGPAGPGPRGGFALPLDDGRLLVARSDSSRVYDPPGRVSGVARGPGGELLVATKGEAQNWLIAIADW